MTKKVVRLGINGFGRIGRNVFKAWLKKTYENHGNKDVEFRITAINDLGDPKTIEHLLSYDSCQPPYTLPCTFKNTLDGKTVPWHIDYGADNGGEVTALYSERDPANIPWDKHNVDIVLECTGLFKSKEKLSVHMKPGVKKVILSCPGQDLDATFVMGVNEDSYDPASHHIVSNASCTTNCLAPLTKVIDQAYGVKSGMMTTVHAYTGDQRLLDAPHSDLRRARAGALNMIPTSTGAAKAVGLVLPHLKGKLNGMAIRVPTEVVSLVDVTYELDKEVSEDEVRTLLAKKHNDYLTAESKPLVSKDFSGNTYSSIVDLEFVQVMNGKTLKVLSWYDNEIGYSNRMLNLASILL